MLNFIWFWLFVCLFFISFRNIDTGELCSDDGDLRCKFEVFDLFCMELNTTGNIVINTGKLKKNRIWQTTLVHAYEHLSHNMILWEINDKWSLQFSWSSFLKTKQNKTKKTKHYDSLLTILTLTLFFKIKTWFDRVHLMQAKGQIYTGSFLLTAFPLRDYCYVNDLHQEPLMIKVTAKITIDVKKHNFWWQKICLLRHELWPLKVHTGVKFKLNQIYKNLYIFLRIYNKVYILNNKFSYLTRSVHEI